MRLFRQPIVVLLCFCVRSCSLHYSAASSCFQLPPCCSQLRVAASSYQRTSTGTIGTQQLPRVNAQTVQTQNRKFCLN
ncbi:uncharacterized protein V1516DRAFT_667260 [Lipomyces oligophaga]|uniref:uncharacterized protein n=1 Tax=Lipomyces oligophaga TaxID=45792 RepID=UPI0034CDE09B